MVGPVAFKKHTVTVCICHMYFFAAQSQKEIEKEQEAQLRAKFPSVKAGGTSMLLQKRLSSKGVQNVYLISNLFTV